MSGTKQPPMGPVGAIGVFLAVFGVWLVVATFFTPSGYGKLANLIAAAVIGGIGALAFVMDRRQRRGSRSGAQS